MKYKILKVGQIYDGYYEHDKNHLIVIEKPRIANYKAGESIRFLHIDRDQYLNHRKIVPTKPFHNGNYSDEENFIPKYNLKLVYKPVKEYCNKINFNFLKDNEKTSKSNKRGVRGR